MRAVLERFPVAAPFERDAFGLRRCFHDRSELVVPRPIPRHLLGGVDGRYIHGMPRQMSAVSVFDATLRTSWR